MRSERSWVQHYSYENPHKNKVVGVCMSTCPCTCVRGCVLEAPAVLKLAVWEPPPTDHHEHPSQGSQQRSELRCQEGRFRDDNSPPAQTLRAFFHTITRVHLSISTAYPSSLFDLHPQARSPPVSLSFPCLSFLSFLFDLQSSKM